jgi:two-component system, OmpR family, response regulator BaeR
MSASILIVEDEVDLAGIMADYITAAGYRASVVYNGAQALALIRRGTADRTPPDLITLDRMLPGLDGIALCRAVREFSQVPIIMVTARVEEIDRLLGLEVGADDYLCKPFSPRELVARIGVILRRARRLEGAAQAEPTLLEIDEAARGVRVRGRLLNLTPTEYALISTMAKRPGTIWPRARLLELVRSDALDVNDRAIDNHIKNLRRKLDAVLPGVDIVQSVYGAGYRVEMN